MTDKTIIFAHQAKSGGTTLIQAFVNTYGRLNVYQDIDSRVWQNMPKWRQELELFAQPYRRYKARQCYKFIHGHFNIFKYQRAFPNAYYLTFYRNPIQRVVSGYYYWLRTPQHATSHPLCRWLHEARPTIVEFAAKLGVDDDKYCKNFAPEQFDFVGITERMGEAMQLLGLYLPELKVDVSPQRINPDKPVGECYVLTEKEQSELSELMKRRVEIYNRAEERFIAEWSKHF